MTGHERRPDMHLTVLGAGTAVPSPRRSPAGYLLRVAGEPLLFDAGPGTLARLAVAGVSHQELRRVFISHLHSDHVLDLVTLLQVSNATPGWTRAEPLELLGCRGLAELVRQVTAAFDGTVPEGFPLQITELGEERRDVAGGGGWMVETALTGHTPGSLAFRVEAAGRTMVYSGDAVESAGLARLAREADTFVCECSFPRGWRTPTTSPPTAPAAWRRPPAPDLSSCRTSTPRPRKPMLPGKAPPKTKARVTSPWAAPPLPS